MSDAQDLGTQKYPIGRFAAPPAYDPELRQLYISQLAGCPAEMRRAIAGLGDAELDTPYRAGGWTLRQVVHHVPDSHMNAYVRHRLAATEEQPTIRPYKEAAWAELPDSRSAGIEVSLALLEALHARWDLFLRSLPEEAFARTFIHPAMPEPVSLDQSVAMYAWHARHHVAHIDSLRRRSGW